MPDIHIAEEILDVYAERTGLTLFLLDHNGAQVTEASAKSPLCIELLDRPNEALLQAFQERLTGGRFPKRVIPYDIAPGLYSLIIPVMDSAYFLCAGVYIEPNTASTLPETLSELCGEGPWQQLTAETAVGTLEKEKKWMAEVEKAASLLDSLKRERAFSYDNQVQMIRSIPQRAGMDRSAFIELAFRNNPQLDFIGLAVEEEEETFCITDMAGEGKALEDCRFVLGEGFLGRALLADREVVWEDISDDTRSAFFREYDFDPTSIYCYPITERSGSRLLLFTGTVQGRTLTGAALEQGQVLAAILEAGSYTSSLQLENRRQIHRLTSLVDICMTMASTVDVKRIVYILVDISMSLSGGAFSCVLLKSENSDKMQLVSRGGNREKISAYARKAAARHYREYKPASQLPEIHETEDGSCIVECPLVHRGELLGILCVSCDHVTRKELEEQQTFLYTLSIIGAVSLQLARQKDEHPEERVISALERAVAEFDLEKHAQSVKLFETAEGFLARLELSDRRSYHILSACRLSAYSPAFLAEALNEQEPVRLLQEARQLLGGKPWSEAEEDSQLTAVLLAYTESGDSLKAVRALGEEEGVLHDFCVFIEEIIISEEEFALGEDDQTSEPYSRIIKERLPLSPREQDVLDLIIKGQNNREIAAALFISDHTVKNHVTKIFQKLRVTDRAQAISKVYQMMYEPNSAPGH
ncbi:response regulator transcription factor [Bacillus daqingensis]